MKNLIGFFLFMAAYLSGDDHLNELKEGNQRFVNNQTRQEELTLKDRQQLSKDQKPFATIIACSDSRVAPELVFDQGPGNLFVVRVAGNTIDQHALGSIEFGVVNLETPLLIVLGHQNCGAVQAALELDSKGYGANVAAILTEITPAIKEVKKNHPNIDDEKLLNLSIISNVEHATQEILHRSPEIRKRLREDKVKILNAMFYIDSGKVEWLPSTP